MLFNEKQSKSIFTEAFLESMYLDKHKLYEGEGVGSDKSWEPEKSFLILGIPLDEAILIGKKYRQNAIVVGKLNEPPQLIWIR